MGKNFKKMTAWEKVGFIVNQPSAEERICLFWQLDGYEERIAFFTQMGPEDKMTYFNRMTAEEREAYLRGLKGIPRDSIHYEDRHLNRFVIFLSGLADYLKNPAADKLEELEELAFRAIPDHYWGLEERCCSEEERDFIRKFLRKLLKRNEQAWGRILQPLSKNGQFGGIFGQMLDVSPLKGKTVLFVSYASGRIMAIQSPQIDRLIEQIKEERGLAINYGYGEYLLSLPVPESDLAEKSKEIVFVDVR